MRKYAGLTLALILVILSFFACERGPSIPKAGSAKVKDMLSLVPEDAIGVVFIDFNRAMATEILDKTIKESKDYTKYQEFVEITKINPQEDIYYVTVALEKTSEEKDPQGGAIVNMKYDKENLLSLIKDKLAEEEKELEEEDYNGTVLYSVLEKEGEKDYLSFIDDSNILAGDEAVVKSIIDVIQEKKENMFKNEALSSLVAQTNKEAMMWGAILIPPEAISQAVSQNPMLKNLEAVNATAMYFDYKNESIIAEIKVMSGDETKNKEVADLLNGFKAMGGIIAAKKPEIGELINKIEVTSSADYVKIYANISEDLINRIKETEEETKEQ